MKTNLIRPLKWLAAVLATILFLAGVPLLALALPSPIDPERGVASIFNAIANDGQVHDEALVSAIAAALWILWAYLVLAAVTETVLAVRGGVRTFRGLAFGQSFTRPIISALMWSSTATGLAASTVGAGGVVLLAAPTATAQVDRVADGTTTATTVEATSSPRVTLADGSLLVRGEHARPHLVTGEPDSFWDLAERHLGDPFRWREIAHLNPQVTDPDVVEPGQVLYLPVDAVDATAPPMPAQDPVEHVNLEGRLVVQPGDTLWSLSEERLEAVHGREPSVAEVAAAVGSIDPGDLASGDHDLIFPGEQIPVARWELAETEPELHVWTAGSVDAAGASPSENGEGRVVQDGDSMWSIADREVDRVVEGAPSSDQVAAYWEQIVDANQAISSGDIDLIVPGEELVLPPLEGDLVLDEASPTLPPPTPLTNVVDGPVASNGTAGDDLDLIEAPSSGLPVEETESGAVGAVVTVPVPASASPTADVVQAQADDRGMSTMALGMMTFGSAMLATGIVGALRRRRNLQQRVRRAGELPRQPSSAAALFGTALAHASHEVRESQLGAGWRLMPVTTVVPLRAAGPLEYHAEETGRLHVVSIDAAMGAAEHTTVSFHFGPVAADDTARSATIGGASVAPTSLLIGTDPETGAAVLLDLASVGRLDVVGDDTEVLRFVQTAALDLATSERADDLLVLAVGLDVVLSDLDRVRVTDSFAEALIEAHRSGHADGDSVTPLVLVSAHAPAPDDPSTDELVARGVLVVAPGLGAPCAVRLDGDRATIEPSGTEVMLSALGNHEFAAVSELIAVSAASASDPVDVSPVCDVGDDDRREPEVVGRGEVEVRILGPVDVEGAGSFSSLKAIDVVTYLAFHRNGVDGDQIKTWVWPAFEPPTDKAFANVMSRARTALGVDSDGRPRLSRAGADRTYRLNETVTTDFDRFQALVARADTATDRSETLTWLQEALGLVRGVPFTGGAASSFAWADNHVRAHVEFVIDETVHRCADLAIELDDLNVARWAVLKGLELVPGCEQCFRRRFLIAGAGNNRSELRRAMADLERCVAADLGEPEALDAISAELLELYHELDRALVSGTL